MRSRIPLVLISLFIISCSLAQVAPRSWEDHLSLNKCNSVSRLGKYMYASYYNGLVYFEEQELAPRKLNKMNGLSDVGIRLLRANEHNNKLLVIYENSNIDIIDENNNIVNYPNLRLKTMSAKKIVNEVTFDKNLAYLACGFGIVVFDTEKLEIRETYYIGPNASNVDVLQVALANDKIYAATPQGLYSASRNSSLINYSNWSIEASGLFPGFYNGVVNAAGNVICCKSEFAADITQQGLDSLFRLENGTWKHFPTPNGSPLTLVKFGYVSGELVTLLTNAPFVIFNAATGVMTFQIYGVNGTFDYGTLRDNYFYKNYSTNTAYWIADNKYGLSRAYTTWEPQVVVTTDGMNDRNLSNIDIHEGRIVVSSAHVFKEGIGTYSPEGVNIFEDNEWSYLPIKSPEGAVLQDINSVLIDRKDPRNLWISSFAYGILQYRDYKVVRSWTNANAGLDQNDNNMSKHGALSQDEDGNIWFTNSEAKRMIGVLRYPDYNYVSFDAPGPKFTRRTFFDRNGYLWIPHERDGGLSVFRHTKFAATEFRTLTMAVGDGNLGSNAVYAVAEDHDGRIWVGTSAGIRVIYNPADIFDGGESGDAQPIKIVQDGNVELLLGAETVTDIQVDGANNKWIGTSGGGVYCFSPDGMRQIYHFTSENSPLYSNSILDLNYDSKTGDLYIGSEQGLQTFRGTVIAGAESYSGFHAFPNPVRPGYAGTVLLRGLMDNSIVKVTDVAGNLVWEAKSTGGQVEWPVTTLSGSRVAAGVYLVYASTTTAESKALTKVLVMN